MDYNVLRKLVANSVDGRDNDPHFRLNMFKLRKKVKGLGLIPVMFRNTYESKRVTPEDIPLLMEYFKEDKVEWFDGGKEYITLIFIMEEDIDDDLQSLLQDLTEAMKPEIVEDRLPCGVIPAKPNMPKDGMNKPLPCKNCKECELYQRPDAVYTLAKIVGNYPCYTAVVAKWVKPDSISLNIRFRANSVLFSDTESESEEETE